MVGIFDRAGRAGDRAGNASRGDHSRDRSVANIANSVATADNAGTANIADNEYLRMEHNTEHIPGLEGPGHPKRAKQTAQPPQKVLSSTCPPPSLGLVAPGN